MLPCGAVFLSVVARPELLAIMAGMDLKDSPRVWCAHRRLWQWHVQGSFFLLALCSLWLQTGPYACHFGRYGPEGHLRSWLVLLVALLSRCVSFVLVRRRCSASWPVCSFIVVRPRCSSSWLACTRRTVYAARFWFRSCSFSMSSDFPVVVQRLIPTVQTLCRTRGIAQLLLNTVIDVPVAVVVQDTPVGTQRLIPMVSLTIEILQFFDKVLEVPVVLVVRVHRCRRGEDSRAPTVDSLRNSMRSDL